MKVGVGSLQLKKTNPPSPPSMHFGPKAVKYLAVCGLALLSSCGAYSKLPQTTRDKVAQCAKESYESEEGRRHRCLRKLATEESTDTVARGEIIGYFEEALHDSTESDRDCAMNKLDSIFWDNATGLPERKMIVELFGEVSRTEDPISGNFAYLGIGDSDKLLRQDAIGELLGIATDNELDCVLRERAIVLLEYPWENEQPFDDDWEGYQKYQHKMSDLELMERTISVLERAIRYGGRYNDGKLGRVALPLLVNFGMDEKAGPEMRTRIFGLLEGFWSKREWTPATRYHAAAHVERDDCNGNSLVESLRAIAMAEKTDQRLRERMVDFLHSGWTKHGCIDNPYILSMLESIGKDPDTGPQLKERVDNIAAQIRDDPLTKIQDDEHKGWTRKAATSW